MSGHDLADLRPGSVDEIEDAGGRAGRLDRLKTPGGAPAASTISAKTRPLIGAISLGFSTTAQPAASAGAALQTI
jgi:hypothetical protein